MTTSSHSGRLCTSAFTLLLAGAAGALTLLPQRVFEASTTLAGQAVLELGQCTEGLFTGDTVIAGDPSAGEPVAKIESDESEFACIGDGCIDLASISSRPAAGQVANDELPELEEPIPVFVSFADTPILPDENGSTATDDPPGSPGPSSPQASGGRSGDGDGGPPGGGGNGGEQFVYLPGTNTISIPSGPNGGSSGGDDDSPPGNGEAGGGGQGGSGGGSGGGGSSGGGSSGGGSSGGGSGGSDTPDDDETSVPTFAAAPDLVTDVPVPATASLFGAALAMLVRGRRRHD